MNTSSVTETKNPLSFKDALFKAVPQSISGRVLFWGALCVGLVLFNLGVNFLRPSPLSHYLPFLALIGGMLVLRWKTAGLTGSYLALGLLLLSYYRDIPSDDRLWQMGLVITFAVDLFILLLVIEDIEWLVGKIEEIGRVKAKELTQAQLQLQKVHQEKAEMQQGLEDEIEHLKAEAEQRRIEKHQESKRIELIQSEIELLTSQKEQIVAEAKKAREVLEKHAQSQTLIETSEAKIADLEKQLVDQAEYLQQIEDLKSQLEDAKANRDQDASLKAENASLQEQIEILTEKASHGEALTHQNAELQTHIDSLTEKLNKAETYTEQTLLSAQEKILTLQVSPVIKVDEKRVKQLEGLHKQLRTQFEEKARLLSQTRKQLFQTQEKLLAVQHEQSLAELAPNREEVSHYEYLINSLVEDLSSLEEEVLSLEAIVDHFALI